MKALLAASSWLGASIATLFGWVGTYSEQIKIGFAVVAAVWVLVEYNAKQQEGRVVRTVDYIKELSTEQMQAADIRMTTFWLEEATEKTLEALPKGDKVAFAEFIIKSVAPALKTEIWQMLGFYKSLAICVNARLCDPATACIRFQRDMAVFVENYGPYFDEYHRKHHDDALRSIRAMLAVPECVVSQPRQNWWDRLLGR